MSHVDKFAKKENIKSNVSSVRAYAGTSGRLDGRTNVGTHVIRHGRTQATGQQER